MHNGNRIQGQTFVSSFGGSRQGYSKVILCKPKFLLLPKFRQRLEPKGDVMLTDNLENENLESEENQENFDELEENQENSEEIEENQENSIDYDLILQELEYIKELQEYEQIIEERQAVALENIQNLCNQLSNTVYFSTGAVISLFVFYVLALVVKFFRSLLDF